VRPRRATKRAQKANWSDPSMLAKLADAYVVGLAAMMKTAALILGGGSWHGPPCVGGGI